MANANPIPFLRRIAKVEAISFLLLLGVAMPLKYIAGIPMAVKVVGWMHGVLFVIFCGALLHTMVAARWSISRAAPIFISALLPFGPLVLDRRMATYEEEFNMAAFDSSKS
jgi:integral membrane protein